MYHMIWYLYILQTTTTITLVNICCIVTIFVMRTFKISSNLSNLQYRIINYSHHTIPHFPGLIYFITGSPYLMTSFTYFSHFPAPANLFSVLMSLDLVFKIPHISEITQYLSLSDLFHLAYCPQGPSMSLQMARLLLFMAE